MQERAGDPTLLKGGLSLCPETAATDFATHLFMDVEGNVANIRRMLGEPGDLVIRKFAAGRTGHACALICIDGLVDKDQINTNILQNIQLGISEAQVEVPSSGEAMLDTIARQVLSAHEIKRLHTLDEATLAILSGDTVLFVDGTDRVLSIGTRGWASRGIEEPITEAVVRGPREGFTENIRTNTALIRRRIRDPNLRLDVYQVGRRSKKDLIVAYIEGIIHPDIVREVNRRLKTIDMDDAPESGFIEQWIQDSFLSPFPTLMHTERPDKVSTSLLQGKVAILLDGTPFVLVAPVTFGQLLHSPEDY